MWLMSHRVKGRRMIILRMIIKLDSCNRSQTVHRLAVSSGGRLGVQLALQRITDLLQYRI